MVFSCFAVYLRIIMHGLYHILPQGGPSTQNMVQPVHDYPRRYTAKQLKTIYYSLIHTTYGFWDIGSMNCSKSWHRVSNSQNAPTSMKVVSNCSCTDTRSHKKNSFQYACSSFMRSKVNHALESMCLTFDLMILLDAYSTLQIG